MADGADTTTLFELADSAAEEFHAFVGCFLELSCRQREVLLDLIRQIVQLEADGENAAVARLLAEAPALLKGSSRTH